MKNLFFILLFIGFSLNAQDFKSIATLHLNKLAADDMFGRGYVNNGYEKAVTYVENEFKKLNLQAINGSYRQSFSYPVNSFPDSVCVYFNAQKLIPGKDFIVDPESGTSVGAFKPIYYEVGNFFMKNEPVFKGDEILIVAPYSHKMSKDSLTIIQERIDKFNIAIPVIELTNVKLTWSVSRNTFSHARIILNANKFDSTVQSVRLNIQNEFIPDFKSANVIGYVKAKRKKCKDFLVVTAHLDHLGIMGSNAVFNGANDNASGISMMLALAEHYSKNRPKINIAFIAFGGEEAGLIGSKFFVENPLIELSKIKFLMNVDLMGNGEDGITVVNATKFVKQFDLLKQVNTKKEYLKLVKPRGEAANSDHYWFTKKDVPSFFIYTMGSSTAYHDVFDRPEQLPMIEINDLCNMVIDFFESVRKL